jgi:hypothetical protein
MSGEDGKIERDSITIRHRPTGLFLKMRDFGLLEDLPAEAHNFTRECRRIFQRMKLQLVGELQRRPDEHGGVLDVSGIESHFGSESRFLRQTFLLCFDRIAGGHEKRRNRSQFAIDTGVFHNGLDLRHRVCAGIPDRPRMIAPESFH